VQQITSILFDLDGTLYSSSELADEIYRASLDGLALQLGVDPCEAGNRLVAAKKTIAARSGWQATLSAGTLELGADLQDLHRYLAEHVDPEQFLQRDERVVAMLQRLRKRFRLYIYTNNNRTLAARIMRATGIDGLFASVFTIEDFWRAKPDRPALAGLYAAINAAPVECLFVGDRYDVDLRLPEEHGSLVFLTTTVAGLLTLEEFCNTLQRG
jgi:putative hydrolase of the HAD superfamily